MKKHGAVILIVITAVFGALFVSASEDHKVYLPLIISSYVEPEFPATVQEFADLVGEDCWEGEQDCRSLDWQEIVPIYGERVYDVIGFMVARGDGTYFRASNPFLKMQDGYLVQDIARKSCGLSADEAISIGFTEDKAGFGIPGKVSGWATLWVYYLKEGVGDPIEMLENQLASERCPEYREIPRRDISTHGEDLDGDGVAQEVYFSSGEEAFGWQIQLSDGRFCSAGCWLPSAPISGWVKDGVVNPYPGEVPEGTDPWEPDPPTPSPTATPYPDGYGERRDLSSHAEDLDGDGLAEEVSFWQGEQVYGMEIHLENGNSCTGGNCWLPEAPVGGYVKVGVINPWPDEVPPDATPWEP